MSCLFHRHHWKEHSRQVGIPLRYSDLTGKFTGDHFVWTIVVFQCATEGCGKLREQRLTGAVPAQRTSAGGRA